MSNWRDTLRFVFVALLLAYVGYIAWPVLVAVFDGVIGATQDSGRFVSHSARFVGESTPTTVAALASNSLQGLAAVRAFYESNPKIITLWVVVIILYLVSAVLFSKGQWRAMLAYVAAFAADIALSVIGAGGDPSHSTIGGLVGGFAGKLIDAFERGDYRFLVLGGALFVGLTLLAAARPDKKDLKKLRPA